MTPWLSAVCRLQEGVWIPCVTFGSKVKVKILNFWLNGVKTIYIS